MSPTIIPANAAPMDAQAVSGEVVVCSRSAKAFDVAFTPEAILDSLEPLRKAARLAIEQRSAPDV